MCEGYKLIELLVVKLLWIFYVSRTTKSKGVRFSQNIRYQYMDGYLSSTGCRQLRLFKGIFPLAGVWIGFLEFFFFVFSNLY